MKRRRLVSSITAVGTIAIAGCSSGSGNSNDGGTSNSGDGDRHPAVDTVDELMTGLYEGDIEKVRSNAVEDSFLYRSSENNPESIRDTRYRGIEIKNEEIKKISTDEVPDTMKSSDYQDRIDDPSEYSTGLEDATEIKVSEYGASDYALVYYYYENQGENAVGFEFLYRVLKFEENWRVTGQRPWRVS